YLGLYLRGFPALVLEGNLEVTDVPGDWRGNPAGFPHQMVGGLVGIITLAGGRVGDRGGHGMVGSEGGGKVEGGTRLMINAADFPARPGADRDEGDARENRGIGDRHDG